RFFYSPRRLRVIPGGGKNSATISDYPVLRSGLLGRPAELVARESQNERSQSFFPERHQPVGRGTNSACRPGTQVRLRWLDDRAPSVVARPSGPSPGDRTHSARTCRLQGTPAGPQGSFRRPSGSLPPEHAAAESVNRVVAHYP